MRKAVKVTYDVVETPRGRRVARNVEVIDAPTPAGTLQWLYDNVDCDTVDVAYFQDNVLGWVDDTGLFKSGNVVAEYNGVPLAGNVIFSRSETDDEGETQWFDSVEEIEKVIDMAERAELKGIVK